MKLRMVSLTDRLLTALLALISLTCTGKAEQRRFSDEAIGFFTKEVRPLLETNCVKCHGGTDSKGNVKVRSNFQIISRRGIVQGGDHGPAFDEGAPAESLLLKMLSYDEEHHQMPPSGKLDEASLATLTEWVKMGMPWTPEDADVLVHVQDDTAGKTTSINDYTKNYWSYRPLVRPEVPTVEEPGLGDNPIDAFIQAKLTDAGLSPNPEASPESLIRRASYNLTGLAPTPEAVAAFAAGYSETSWHDLVEALLESPQYGETWARHWLDSLRYAESNGFERDSEKDHIWRFRDYVIQAFNDDKPYDQFIKEQLAGDELDEVTPESLIATGYHRLMQWDDEPADRLQHRFDVLDDNVRTTSETFLGMTMGCARCHDHKGDPISQKDYYGFMAFFNGVTQMDKQRVIGEVSLPLPPEKRAALEKERLEGMSRVAERIQELENIAKAKLSELVPSFKAESWSTTSGEATLVADARAGGSHWDYTSTAPDESWSSVGFRPERWKRGEAPFGKETPWEAGDLWLQNSFGLTSLPGRLWLTIRNSGHVEVYLNGQRIHESDAASSDYQRLELGLEALQTGRNVLAVRASHGQAGFFDLGLEGDYGVDRLAALIKKHGDEIFTPVEYRSYKQALRRLETMRQEAKSDGVKAMMVQEVGPRPEAMHVHMRGNANVPGDEVAPAFPSIFGEEAPVLTEPDANAKTSGRRRVLAEWIASKKNRRTARVMVNRVWQHHFGRGLCPTPNDFGFLGEQVSHPELLDWLACEFMERGWSLKELHRLIMSSKTYRRSAAGNAVALSKDPQNLLLWRVEMRRLTAEEIRDSMLEVTGKLNLAAGGPSFFPTLPQEVLVTSSTGAGKWGKSTPEEENRRSIYMKIKRSLMAPQMIDFDFADADAPCAARFVTTVPAQALALLNSQVINDYAKALADRLEKEAGDDPKERVRRGLELVFCRSPKTEEIDRCLAMMNTFEKEHGLSTRDTLERFCLLALNLNEFVYLD